MIHLNGFARVGRDAELRRLPNGDAVCNVSLAFNYGRKDDKGDRPTQWVEASLFGKRAESLAQYLLKGTPVVVAIEGAHIETYEGRSGTGAKLVGRMLDITLAGRAPDQQSQARAAAPAAASRQQPNAYAAQKGGSGFDDMDDDIFF